MRGVFDRVERVVDGGTSVKRLDRGGPEGVMVLSWGRTGDRRRFTGSVSTRGLY